MNLFEDLPALSPVQFFGLSCDCFYFKRVFTPEKISLLPSTADLLGEESFADIYVGWNMEKLAFFVSSCVPFQDVDERDFRKGDCVELFIDTRDVKTRGGISRFCHHFVFFPTQVQNFYGREITRFRGDDIHRLCHPEDLQVAVSMDNQSYQLSIEIPSSSLYGYDPLTLPRLGFTYRVNRLGSMPQHFAVSSEEYTIEHHPATWGSLQLVKEES